MFINVFLFLSSACVVYDTTKGTSGKLQVRNSNIVRLMLVYIVFEKCFIAFTFQFKRFKYYPCQCAHQASCGPRTNFHLYLRLAVIMGLTWIVGLVAALVDMEEVWFAFVILNTTQGIFIFASFTCNKKVGASLKSRLCGGKHTYRPGMAVSSRRTRDGTELKSFCNILIAIF